MDPYEFTYERWSIGSQNDMKHTFLDVSVLIYIDDYWLYLNTNPTIKEKR